MTSAECLFGCRLQAQLQAAEAHAEDVEQAVQGQLVSALNKLAALDVEPPQAIVSSLAGLQALAESVRERCARLEAEAAAAHRSALACITGTCRAVLFCAA